ncbi:hypothetical protein O3P69_011537 [Scylla paramamosain]|uniref:Uncharacterized protein n=1 Tax=Scylla paramamosain TaxID=85552 RepID=A0AAW0T816_SCYPA
MHLSKQGELRKVTTKFVRVRFESWFGSRCGNEFCGTSLHSVQQVIVNPEPSSVSSALPAPPPPERITRAGAGMEMGPAAANQWSEGFWYHYWGRRGVGGAQHSTTHPPPPTHHPLTAAHASPTMPQALSVVRGEIYAN